MCPVGGDGRVTDDSHVAAWPNEFLCGTRLALRVGDLHDGTESDDEVETQGILTPSVRESRRCACNSSAQSSFIGA